MTTIQIVLAIVVVIGILILLGIGSERGIKTLRYKHMKWLDTQAFVYFFFASIELRYGNRVTYLDYGDKPHPVHLKDLHKGDFQETVYLLIDSRSIQSFPTKALLLENVKPHLTLAAAAVTVDKFSRVDIESIELPGTIITPNIAAGWHATKELTTPTIGELINKYR